MHEPISHHAIGIRSWSPIAAGSVISPPALAPTPALTSALAASLFAGGGTAVAPGSRPPSPAGSARAPPAGSCLIMGVICWLSAGGCWLSAGAGCRLSMGVSCRLSMGVIYWLSMVIVAQLGDPVVHLEHAGVVSSHLDLHVQTSRQPEASCRTTTVTCAGTGT